ncbi:B-related factor 1 [Caenorhabditis elegans]|uniref:B-related factor 1 n=1 Tax=Caenorhabditis elegans TaxID=6239 RepID=A0A131MBG0_CAEEL|nr:B-related factor 1 [Caenorhabditis elegans]CZR14474.1 B-related factor 1 [Caenorhabditis elegans]|eukprot:NP_001309558.1 BRF (transcription factor) homolog [Caenorhabditis elegans]
MVRTCSNCGSSEIDEDAARGDATCTACGTVLEESIVVTENQFQERAGGSGHTLVGQFVSSERAAANNFNGMGSQESREMTYAKGRKVIDELGSQLRINSHCMNTAFNFYKMCVSRNLTRGRNRSSVVAVCMYITCRLENTAHLLLDFSDVTQINVFDLGRNLNYLSRSLRINLPSTDPCLYIMRFACVLDFGDKQKEVVNLATRLVQRMKRDWMSTGRRPTGICGAALLIAARSLNFNRSINDIVRVVHISEGVIRKRLDEFSQTPSGSLTIDEFSTVDLEHSEDPPAYRESRRKAREDQLRKEAEQAESMKEQLGEMEAHVEAALDKKRKEKFSKSPYARMISENLGLEKGADEMVRNEIINTVFNAAEEDPCTSNSLEKYDKYRPSLESLGIKRTSEPEPEPVPHPIVNADLEEDISDSEIDSYILTESEVAIKTDYWMKANGEAMKEIEEKKRERELNGGVKKKKPRSNRKTDTTSTSVASAVEKVIAEKKLSNKVNYEMLKDLETMATGIKRDIRESTPAPVTPISIKVDSSDVTPDTLSKSEKIARGKNIRSQASESTIQKLRSIFDLTEECSETSKNSSPKVNLKVESASPSTSEVSSIEHKPFVPPARSRYAKVKPIIGAKKLAALNEVKNVHTVPEPSAPAEPIVSEAPLQVKTSSSDPIVTSTEVPSVAEPPAPIQNVEEAKPIVPVKSRYAKAKPNLKPIKQKTAVDVVTVGEGESSEPSAKRTKAEHLES